MMKEMELDWEIRRVVARHNWAELIDNALSCAPNDWALLKAPREDLLALDSLQLRLVGNQFDVFVAFLKSEGLAANTHIYIYVEG